MSNSKISVERNQHCQKTSFYGLLVKYFHSSVRFIFHLSDKHPLQILSVRLPQICMKYYIIFSIQSTEAVVMPCTVPGFSFREHRISFPFLPWSFIFYTQHTQKKNESRKVYLSILPTFVSSQYQLCFFILFPKFFLFIFTVFPVLILFRI